VNTPLLKRRGVFTVFTACWGEMNSVERSSYFRLDEQSADENPKKTRRISRDED
jgi:hypothetical protein